MAGTGSRLPALLPSTVAQGIFLPISLTIAANTTKTVDVSHLANPRILIVKLLSGDGFRLALRRSATDATDLSIGRFFAAEVMNIEQVKLSNETSAAVRVQLELVSIPAA